MPPAIRVENLGKKYHVAHGTPREGYRTLRESLVRAAAAPLRKLRRGLAKADAAEDFWALRDVGFDVQSGEVVGIIGRNGAGKSTLLKILSRITKPTLGRAEINGRVGSLLEVGTGFHPELTGRENVFLNGSILGMSHKEIDRKFDAIVAFAGVERFLDTPVKRYSSGMYVRLAFAVAAHLEPEILIIDEVLAVGDAEFQKKCIEKMRSVSRSGHTVLLVSHNLTQIESLCDRVITLRGGELVGCGAPDVEIRKYLAEVKPDESAAVDLRNHAQRVSGATPVLTGLVISADGTPATIAKMGGNLGFDVEYRMARKPRDLRVGIVLENVYGVKVTAVSPTFQAPHLLDDPPAAGRIRAEIPRHNLVAGTYAVNLFLEAEGLSDCVAPAAHITIEADDVFGSARTLDARVAVTYQNCLWTKSW